MFPFSRLVLQSFDPFDDATCGTLLKTQLVVPCASNLHRLSETMSHFLQGQRFPVGEGLVRQAVLNVHCRFLKTHDTGLPYLSHRPPTFPMVRCGRFFLPVVSLQNEANLLRRIVVRLWLFFSIVLYGTLVCFEMFCTKLVVALFCVVLPPNGFGQKQSSMKESKVKPNVANFFYISLLCLLSQKFPL